jgi:hypothetical protein
MVILFPAGTSVFSKASVLALVAIMPSVQWVPGVLSLGLDMSVKLTIHLHSASSPYAFLTCTRINSLLLYLRVAAAARIRDRQSVRSRIELRERLKCKSFEWYLDNIWPQHFLPKEDRFFGKVSSDSAVHNSLCLKL